MINLEKIKWGKCQPPPLLRRPAPAPYFYSLFLIVHFPPPGEVINIHFPLPLKKRGVGGPNYVKKSKNTTL